MPCSPSELHDLNGLNKTAIAIYKTGTPATRKRRSGNSRSLFHLGSMFGSLILSIVFNMQSLFPEETLLR